MHNPHTTNMDEVSKASCFVGDILMDEDEQMTITGAVQVLDMTGMEAGHLLQMTPAGAKKAMTIWQVGK